MPFFVDNLNKNAPGSNDKLNKVPENGYFKIIGIGRVKKTIFADNELDEDFQQAGLWRSPGAIKYELVYEFKYWDGLKIKVRGKTKNLSIAYPMSSFISTWPVQNEIVLLMTGPTYRLNDGKEYTQVYYIGPYNIWNSPNHNSFPDLKEYETRVNDNKESSENIDVNNFNPPKLYGSNFSEDFPTPPLISNGDVVYSGRFGQHIKFGHSTPKSPNLNTYSDPTGELTEKDPITIISNKMRRNEDMLQKFNHLSENINEDGSAIWLTSKQKLNLNLSEYKLLSFIEFKDNPTIIINTSQYA